MNGVAMSAEELEQAIADLRAELAALPDELATDVRTRRLVVVDQAGEERITTYMNDNYVNLAVTWPSDNDLECPNKAMIEVNGDSADLSGSISGNIVLICSPSKRSTGRSGPLTAISGPPDTSTRRAVASGLRRRSEARPAGVADRPGRCAGC